ncbi:hypothetical protein EV192_112298 [Actinocrispum wychmicini]|uniref:Uncharacterized protein n=1 Tax=Actinocrispum wychmicini TaxID=1213861 RepID=A0A4R2J7I6_9PSEU|nr:hypothetical protein EV192_112298 [Actinocrispum wychmicini]
MARAPDGTSMIMHAVAHTPRRRPIALPHGRRLHARVTAPTLSGGTPMGQSYRGFMINMGLLAVSPDERSFRSGFTRVGVEGGVG